VDEVGILAGVLAAGAEPDLPFVLVDTVDGTDHEFAPGNLVLDLSLWDVNEVEMTPAVALRRVDKFVGLLQPGQAGHRPVHALRVGRPDERLRLFVDEVADTGGVGIDLDQAVALVTTVVLLVGKGMAVLPPAQARTAQVGTLDCGLDLLGLGDIEQVKLIGGEPVARQGIGARP